MSRNILQGGGRRGPAIAAALEAHPPDVIALTEIRSKSTQPILRGLIDRGWIHSISTNPPGIDYGLAVLSKVPVRQLPSQSELPCGGVRWLEVAFPDVGFTLDTVYILPGDGKDRTEKAVYWEALLAALARRVETPYLLVGDLNTGRHYIDEPGKTIPCADKFERLGQTGWTDLWRHFHGDRREATWYSHRPGGGQGNGFRLDHAFASAAVLPRITGCWYSHEEREAGLSDHSVLVVEVE